MTNHNELSSTAGGDTQAALDAGAALSDPAIVDPGTIYSVTVPAGAHRETVDLEPLLAAPRRKRGIVQLHDCASLARMVQHHEPDGVVTIYADQARAKITAVLNDHGATTPGWGDHRAVLQLRYTPAWARWTEADGKLGGQSSFAELIEDRNVDIVEPPGAEMLELAQTFQATTSVEFRTQKRLADGQTQLTYHETIDAKAGQGGDIVIPKEFTVALAPYEGCDPYKVKCRLRFRVRDGALLIGFVMDRPEDVLKAAFADVADVLGAETGIEAYLGEPPSRP